MDATPTPGSMAALTRLAKVVYRRSNDVELGITLRQLVTLTYLRDHEGVPQQTLCGVMHMDASNLVLLLNDLERLGFVSRQRDPEDRRRHLVELTPPGRRAIAHAEHGLESVEDDVLGALSDKERETFHRLLTKALQGAVAAERADAEPAPTR
ncbi:MAG: transcriptional regulator, MarR family [Solirubrobacterales bacterium]|nr:transcriptional regulator, MarR family [Solirubrobacterales bacterium]